MLGRALDDVLEQTFADWGIVVVNDGGAPSDVERLIEERATALGDRVLVLHSDVATGRPSAANRGFDQVSGEYVVLHDDDDRWHPDFLQRTVDYLDATPDAVAVTVPTEIVTETDAGEELVDVERQPFNPPGGVVTLFDLILINRIVPISMLLRASALEKIGGWDESLKCVGDWEFNLRLATYGQIGFLHGETLAFWMHRPDVTEGPNANSMFRSADGHFEFDRRVRDRALAPDGPHHEIGQLLYLSKFIDERLRQSEERILQRIGSGEERLVRRIGAAEDRLRGQVHQRGMTSVAELREDIVRYSFGATVRRLGRRFKRKGRSS